MKKKFKREKRHQEATTDKSPRIVAIDLFCGAGGLTRGLERSGIDVELGVDIDPDCVYPYTKNNKARFLLKSVAALSKKDISSSKSGYSLLAGCAPCQPFSTYRQKADPKDHRWNLLRHFSRLAQELKPDFITMENVPNLEKQDIFKQFVSSLKNAGFYVSHSVVDCVDYGIPQQRRRLVLLASKLGQISLLAPRTGKKPVTVRDAIGRLPRLKAGQTHKIDPLHQASCLSELNLKRIRSSKPGGSWHDWDKSLVAKCHTKETGENYKSVYGRMKWDEPAPTITTQYYGFGSGRFGHPSQARAISLREGALLQSFPKNYQFVSEGTPVHSKTIGRLVGNAVPVKLAEAIGKSFIEHLKTYTK